MANKHIEGGSTEGREHSFGLFIHSFLLNLTYSTFSCVQNSSLHVENKLAD